jgi:hypothetical protein
MAGGVQNKKTFGRKIKGHDKDIENLYGLINAEGNNSAAISGKAIIAGTSPGEKSQFLPLKGGQMQGPIGYFPSAIAINGGNLRLGETAAGDPQPVRQIVHVSPQSGTTDELDTIEGRLFHGQHLTLVGIVGNTIKIKHNLTSAENADERAILCPNDKDFNLEAWMAIDLFFDDVSFKWRIKGGAGGGGGATFKLPVRAATNVNVAVLANTAELQDGVTLVEGDRLLLKNQTTQSENGVYVMGAITGGDGPITRADDMSTSDDAVAGAMWFVEEGNTNQDTLWAIATNNPITLDTTSIEFRQIGTDYIPQSRTVSSDILTVGNYSQRFVVSGEGAVDDDIKFINILDPRIDGIYSLQGVAGHNLTLINQTITTPPDSNHKKIRTPSGADFVMTGNQTILLQYDSTAGEFVVTSSGATFDPIILNETDRGNVSGAINIDWSAGNFHRMVLTGDTNISFVNMPPAGKYEQIVVQIKQDVTGGHAVTWNDIFTNGNEPVISTAADAYSVVTFYTYDDGADQFFGFNTTQITSMAFAMSDEFSQLGKTSSTKRVFSFRMPHKMTLTDVRISLSGAGTGGLTVVDVRHNGSTIFSTLPNISAGSKTSTNSPAPVVISTPILTDDAEMTVFMTAKAKGATGLKLYLVGFI